VDDVDSDKFHTIRFFAGLEAGLFFAKRWEAIELHDDVEVTNWRFEDNEVAGMEGFIKFTPGDGMVNILNNDFARCDWTVLETIFRLIQEEQERRDEV
jgi:hypothetical protein